MSHRRFNNLLSVIVILLGLYIAVSPFLPEISYRLRDKSADASAPYSGDLAQSVGSNSNSEIPQENRIVIPSIQVNEPIKESSNIGVINDGGTWRRPNVSTPDQNDNTVIVGHRFFKDNISTFYHLDKVKPGHRLAVYWDGKEYLYEVTETKVVDPSAVEIENRSDEKKLTIYTCTPIWTARERLVVIAKPVTLEEQS